jgi:hypothetical protein
LRALPHTSILKNGPFLKPIPIVKLAALAAALACAGGAAFIGPGSAAGTTTSLDHFLCAPRLGPACRSVAVTLPDGSTAAVGDANARLRCEPAWSWHRSRHHGSDAGDTVAVTNELSPAGPSGQTPVVLVERYLRWNCSLGTSAAPAANRSRDHSRRFEDTTSVATFACFAVDYPSRDAVQFTSPYDVQVNGSTLRVGRPSVLCEPTDTSLLTGGSNALVCFDTFGRGSWHHPWWGPELCVPSSSDGAPVVGPPDPTTSPTSATTTTTTTTTVPTASSTTTTGSTTSTTTTSSTTSTTTTTTTTTTPPSSTQPCAGRIINGVCVINL